MPARQQVSGWTLISEVVFLVLPLMRVSNFQFGLLASVLVHAGILGGLCACGFSVSGPAEVVYNVEIVSEAAAVIGPGGGSADPDRSIAVRSALPQAVAQAVQPVALRSQILSLAPALKKAPARRLSPVFPAAQEASSSSAPEAQAAGLARGDGQGPVDGYGSPSGLPGGTGTGSGAQIRLIEAPKPPFPWAARRDGFEGRAVFDVLVANDGNLRTVNLLQGSGRPDCDDAALNTIREKWRFAAAVSNGQPVTAWGRVSVRYQLE